MNKNLILKILGTLIFLPLSVIGCYYIYTLLENNPERTKYDLWVCDSYKLKSGENDCNRNLVGEVTFRTQKESMRVFSIIKRKDDSMEYIVEINGPCVIIDKKNWKCGGNVEINNESWGTFVKSNQEVSMVNGKVLTGPSSLIATDKRGKEMSRDIYPAPVYKSK